MAEPKEEDSLSLFYQKHPALAPAWTGDLSPVRPEIYIHDNPLGYTLLFNLTETQRSYQLVDDSINGDGGRKV